MKGQQFDVNTQTMGNKAANLVELASMLNNEKFPVLKKISVSVPKLCPLEHKAIQTYLTKYAPAWLELWDQFKIAQGEESKNLTERASEILKQLRSLIQDVFNNHPFYLDELTYFLERADADTLLMVRSTGKEDAEDVANPGGNESVAAVQQNVVSISNAMGRVVASYFSDKSLLQRLSSKQDILDNAFMPVLIQRMIRECTGNEDNPVVSGVMYTGDAGIQIQMAPGHGEYIVNSQGPFDTVFVSREHIVHTEINHKRQRLVPATSSLVYQENSPRLASSLSIEREYVAEIARIGQSIQEHYGMPMDVEFVYDPTSRILHLVQARPIPSSSLKLIPPSSISPQKTLFVKEHGDVIKADVITAAGNVAQIITKPEEILLTNNISDALERYLHNQLSPLKAVVLSEKAPQTSHEAAQFNMMGICVLHVSSAQLKNLELRIQNPSFVLIIDPQRKQLIDWTKNINTHGNAMEELKTEGILEEGLFQSSLSIYESLLPLFKGRAIAIRTVPDDMTQSMSDLIEKANSDETEESEQAFNMLMQRLFKHLTPNLIEGISLYEAFEQLKAQKNLAALKKILTKLYQLARNPAESIEMNTLYKKIFQQAMINGAEIAIAIDNPLVKQQEWLDAVARLELLVTAPFNFALKSSSIHQLLELKKLRKNVSSVKGFDQLTDEQQQYFISFFQTGKLIVDEQKKQRWILFAMSACKTSFKCQALATLIYFMQENGIIAVWLNIYFDQEKSIAKMGTECSKIIEELHFFQLERVRNTMNVWENRLLEWSSLKNFDQLETAFNHDILPIMAHLDIHDGMHPLTKKTVLKTVQDLTELIDKTIKSLKGSLEYREHGELLVERFYSLLMRYHALMKTWVSKLPAAEFKQKETMMRAIEDRFSELKQIKNAQQLHPSRRANISSMTVDSVARFERQFDPNTITLEDLFSLIHQNILVATTVLGKDSQIKPEQLPLVLRELHDELSVRPYENNGPGVQGTSSAALMSTSLVYPMIYLDYNLPLRGHSAKFLLNYNQDTGKIVLKVKFFGHNERNRMDKIAQLAIIEGAYLCVEIVRKPNYDNNSHALEWTWEFDRKQQQSVLKSMHGMIQDCADMSYYEYENTQTRCMKQMISRHQGFERALPSNTPERLQQFVDALALENKELDIPRWPRVDMPVDSKTILIKTCNNEQSIQLTYILQSDVEQNPNCHLLCFTVDYDLLHNKVDFEINLLCIMQDTAAEDTGEPKFNYNSVKSIILGAELEGALLNMQMVSPPHFNEKTKEINWRWRLTHTDNMADLSTRLIKSFNAYAYYKNSFPALLKAYAKEVTSSVRLEQIIQCVKDFFTQGKHIRCAIDCPDEPEKEWITRAELQTNLPPELLPSAKKLFLFDEPQDQIKASNVTASQDAREVVHGIRDQDLSSLKPKSPGGTSGDV